MDGDAGGAGHYVLNSESIVRCGDPLAAGTRYVEYGPLTNAVCGLAMKSRRIGVSPRMSVVTIAAWITEGQNCA